MKKLLLFLCLLAHPGFSQSNRIDSLKRELVNMQKRPDSYPKDTLYYQTLKAIMWDYADINIDSSVHYNNLTIELCIGKGLQKELIYAHQFAAYLCQIKGDHYQSILSHYKALSLAEKLTQYTRMGVSYSGLAHAYTSLKDYPKATKFCLQGLAVLRQYPHPLTQLSILNVLGSIYREQGKLTDALKVNQAMYTLAQKEHNQWYESQGLHAIGWVYREMGNLSQALDYYEKALKLSRREASVELEGNILVNMADIYILQKNGNRL